MCGSSRSTMTRTEEKFGGINAHAGAFRRLTIDGLKLWRVDAEIKTDRAADHHEQQEGLRRQH